MKTRCMPKIGRDISLLGFGLMRLPCVSPENQAIDYELADRMVDMAVASGVNYFDTAWMYHEYTGENFAGHTLSRYPREKYHLASKLPPWEVKTADDARRIFDTQLEKCRVDYFDFYLLHALNGERYTKVLELGLLEILQRKKEEGLIRHLGFSFHDSSERLAVIADGHDWDFAQIQLNYVDWTDLDAKGQYEALTSRGIPVVVMEPVRGGALASLAPKALDIFHKAAPQASPASWAIRFAASLPGVMCVLSGMSSLEQVEDNLKTMSDFKAVSSEEMKIIESAGAVFRASRAIPCTGCRYCIDCPSGVAISRIFSIYNHYCVDHNRMTFDNAWRTLGESERPGNCVSCGTCIEHCPQGIDIPKFMHEISEFAS